MRYDLIIIGSGPNGVHGALTAAKLRKRVALVDQRPEGADGVSVHAGGIPSKALREAILLLTGFRHRAVFPDLFQRRRRLTMPELQVLSQQVARNEADCVQQQLRSHGVETIVGKARFVGSTEVEISHGQQGIRRLSGDQFLIDVGSKPNRPSWVPFDGRTILDSDELLKLDRIPRSMIVVGGGVVGLEYAMMFAVLGVHVGVVDAKPRLLEFCDLEMASLLLQQAETLGVQFRLGQQVIGIEKTSTNRAAVRLEGGQHWQADTVLYAAGRRGNTDSLDLRAAGLMRDEQGRLWCNEDHQTWIKHIYGVGDVVGFPARGSVSIEPGRRAILHAFGQSVPTPKQIPYGLFTIPELAMVGPTEEMLRDERVPYEVGIAQFHEVPRGHIAGRPEGMLKLLLDRESLQLLGVHCLGESATDLVHIGQTVMSFGGTIKSFRDTVFNDSTMAECYKLAAADALNHLEDQHSVPAPFIDQTAASAFDDETEDTDIEVARSVHVVPTPALIRHRRLLARRH